MKPRRRRQYHILRIHEYNAIQECVKKLLQYWLHLPLPHGNTISNNIIQPLNTGIFAVFLQVSLDGLEFGILLNLRFYHLLNLHFVEIRHGGNQPVTVCWPLTNTLKSNEFRKTGLRKISVFLSLSISWPHLSCPLLTNATVTSFCRILKNRPFGETRRNWFYIERIQTIGQFDTKCRRIWLRGIYLKNWL